MVQKLQNYFPTLTPPDLDHLRREEEAKKKEDVTVPLGCSLVSGTYLRSDPELVWTRSVHHVGPEPRSCRRMSPRGGSAHRTMRCRSHTARHGDAWPPEAPDGWRPKRPYQISSWVISQSGGTHRERTSGFGLLLLLPVSLNPSIM